MGAADRPPLGSGKHPGRGFRETRPSRKYGFLGILKVISCLIPIHISPQNGKEYTKKNTGKAFILI